MQVLHIISGDGGGVATYLKNLIKYKDREFHYTVISFGKYSNSFKRLAKNTNTKLIQMPRPKEAGYINFFKFLTSFFQDYKFDFIVSHIPGIYSIIFKIISKIYNTNLFCIHSHQTNLIYGREMKFSEKIINYINPKINNIVASRKIACGVDAAMYGFETSCIDKVDIVHNSVETEKFYRIFNKKNDKNDKIVIGHIGRHTPAKNLEFILGLANYIKSNKKQKQIEIQLVGDGELTGWLKSEIKQQELGDIIHLQGRRNDVDKALSSFDILILPSYSEGLPTVLIEAQASGTPCIVSNTITTETDLGVGLIAYLNNEKESRVYEQWINKSYSLKRFIRPPLSEVENRIIKYKFTPELMAKAFEDIVIEAIMKKR